MQTDVVMAYMAMSGVLGFLQDRLVLIMETVLLRWKR